MGAIQAIETYYNGFRFRSRLEARWAVFFDCLGIQYDYEPQGFEISEGYENGKTWYYLPDFFLPEYGTWVEVKGSTDHITDNYLEMLMWAVDWGGCLPNVEDSTGTTRGLLLLGPIPNADHGGLPAFPILQHGKGGWIETAIFNDGQLLVEDSSWDYYFDPSTGDGLQQIRTCMSTQYELPSVRPIGRVSDAFRKARTARFEHGETPRGR